jgi:glycolate dehydrogenase FAD-binding subunit
VPDISAQLIDAVKSASSENRKLNLCGFGSKAFMGRQLTGEALPLSLTGHSGIVNYQPLELLVTVRAGTAVSEIQSVLDEHDQLLPFEPPDFRREASSPEASIGGTLAANVSGPARPWMGSIRDTVLGTRLINGRGEHLRFGGQVMKNVAGYDASRLQAGAMGTLGIITELSLKVLPRPVASTTLVVEAEAEEAVVMMNQLSAQAKPLSGACWLEGKLFLRLSGSRMAVEATAQLWRGTALAPEEASQFWSDLANQRLAFFSGDKPLWRFSVRSSAVMDRSAAVAAAPWLVDWAGAQRWLRGDFDRAELEALAEAAGGQLMLFRGAQHDAEVFHTMPPAMQALQKRVKTSFDPDGLFNPGRLYSWM